MPAFAAWTVAQEAAGRLEFEVKGRLEAEFEAAAAALEAPALQSFPAAEEEEAACAGVSR